MTPAHQSHFRRLFNLVMGTLSPPPGKVRITIALVYGVVCQVTFGVAVLAMITAMFFGLS